MLGLTLDSALARVARFAGGPSSGDASARPPVTRRTDRRVDRGIRDAAIGVGPGILYNTLQGLSAAAALLLLPVLARDLRRPDRGTLEGWGRACAVLGLVLFATGCTCR